MIQILFCMTLQRHFAEHYIRVNYGENLWCAHHQVCSTTIYSQRSIPPGRQIRDHLYSRFPHLWPMFDFHDTSWQSHWILYNSWRLIRASFSRVPHQWRQHSQTIGTDPYQLVWCPRYWPDLMALLSFFISWAIIAAKIKNDFNVSIGQIFTQLLMFLTFCNCTVQNLIHSDDRHLLLIINSINQQRALRPRTLVYGWWGVCSLLSLFDSYDSKFRRHLHIHTYRYTYIHTHILLHTYVRTYIPVHTQ